MNEDRDPDIQALFAAADQELDDAAFMASVAARLGRPRRARWLAGGALTVVLLALVLLLAGPLQGLALWLSWALAVPLVPVSASGVAATLAPLNSVGFVAALTLFGFWRGWRFIAR